MNAYELADKLQMDKAKALLYVDTVVQSAEMLRQQADRIAELEKESANLEQSLKNALIFIDNRKQTKPLSDEEINELIVNKVTDYELCRAIEERHGIK